MTDRIADPWGPRTPYGRGQDRIVAHTKSLLEAHDPSSIGTNHVDHCDAIRRPWPDDGG
ncbi:MULTISPECIES: hypothetical protein [Mycobacterium]|uniref:hypothetical protein n=1 Tax=Mycobacterium TaxID=1763 RepID=UPI0013565A0F|nr:MULTISPECIES: hypothetical protein [Mycobacterium]